MINKESLFASILHGGKSHIPIPNTEQGSSVDSSEGTVLSPWDKYIAPKVNILKANGCSDDDSKPLDQEQICRLMPFLEALPKDLYPYVNLWCDYGEPSIGVTAFKSRWEHIIEMEYGSDGNGGWEVYSMDEHTHEYVGKVHTNKYSALQEWTELAKRMHELLNINKHNDTLSAWDRYVVPRLNEASIEGHDWEEMSGLVRTGKHYLKPEHRERLVTALKIVPEQFLKDFHLWFDGDENSPCILVKRLRVAFDIDDEGVAVYTCPLDTSDKDVYFYFDNPVEGIDDTEAIAKFAELVSMRTKAVKG